MAAAICLVILGSGSAKVAARPEPGAAPTARPATIYVTDFELHAKAVKADTGRPPLPPPPRLPPLLGRQSPAPTTDPAARARELVDLMSTSLVENLTKAGLTARRLGPAEARPTAGWLVRGVFTQVDEGNRLRRAVVGFGAGQTQMQLLVAVDDLAKGTPKPLYDVNMTAEGSKAPGAGPLIAFHPAAVAVRFALAGGDLERNVKQAAATIATDVARRVAKNEE